MPRIKRWFPVSRDIFSDPQVTELLEIFGHEGFTLWMACLKMAEDDEGVILARSYASFAGSLATLSRTTPETAEKAIRAWIKWRWLSQEWYASDYGSGGMVFRTNNYSKYHPNQTIRRVNSFSTPPRAQRRSNFTEGEQRTNQAGYIQVYTRGRWRLLHLMVAEEALGKPIPPGAIVHHANLNKALNVNQNLVICNDASYHNLLHRRTFERFEIDSSGRFIRKSRELYYSQVGKHTVSLLPSEPSEPSEHKKSPSVDSKSQKTGLDPEVKKWADLIYHSNPKRYARLITWIKAALRNYSPAIVATTLEKFSPYASDDNLGNWWPYLDKILDKQEGLKNARNNEIESARIKREEKDFFIV